MRLEGKPEEGKVWQREDEDEEVLTLFLPRMTKTISNQKTIAMTTDPMGTISSTLVFSSAPRINTTALVAAAAVHKQPHSEMQQINGTFHRFGEERGSVTEEC